MDRRFESFWASGWLELCPKYTYKFRTAERVGRPYVSDFSSAPRTASWRAGLASRNLRTFISLNCGAGNSTSASIGNRLQSGSPASKDRRKARSSSVNDPLAVRKYRNGSRKTRELSLRFEHRAKPLQFHRLIRMSLAGAEEPVEIDASLKALTRSAAEQANL